MKMERRLNCMAKEPKNTRHVKGVYKRGNIYWIAYAGLDGRISRESSGGDKFKAAEDLLIERKQSVREGKQPEVKKITNHIFKELATQYKVWIEGRQSSAKVKGYVIGQLETRFGTIPLRRFNMMLVEQLQTDLIAKGHKNAYTNKVLNVLKAMFTKAVEWEMVEEDILRRVRKVKGLREDKRLRFLTVQECHNLINVCDKHLKPIVITALNTGMRRGEMLGMQRKHLDLTHGFILLDKTKNGDRREIPINNTLRELFQSLPKRLDSPYVFFHPETGLPYGEIKHSFETARKRAGLEDLHFHDLRHTFASHLVMAGVDLATIKELLGHKDIKMTLRYAHLAPAHKTQAVDILDKTFQKGSTSQKLHNLEIVG
ncbi:MAG: hypothetical protein C0392_14260 [Syntrophus sp. (in: bacteria)]|nr:hypothetical protein [Syntrophus sp. (in: bacteria)]